MSKPITAGSVRPSDFTDVGNAAVFVREYRDSLIYTDAMGWLCWDGKRWEKNDHKALEKAEEFSQRMLEDARASYLDAMHRHSELKADTTGESAEKDKAAEEEKREKAYFAHAMQTRRSPRVKAIVDLSRPYLVRPGNAMDADPLILNTQAGIVNLVTGEWRPNTREALCTQITAVSRSNEGSELWDDFLNTITCGVVEDKEFLQSVIGMALFGAVYQEGAVFAIGDGRNGKSTFFNAVSAALGDYAGSIDIDVLSARRANNNKASLATLRKKRLVIAGEWEEGCRLSAATLKRISSTDAIEVEEKYRAPEKIKPTHTLCLFMNHMPRINSTDDGTWSRIIAIPFDAKLQGEGTISNYGKYLEEHAAGAILSWAIEGAQKFAANSFKLDIPDNAARATADYRERENWLKIFIDARCLLDPNGRVGARELYGEYRDYAETVKEYIRSEKEFAAEMGKAEFRSVQSKGRKYYKGLKIDLGRKFGGSCRELDIL